MKLEQIDESLFSGIVKFILTAGAVIGAIYLIKNAFFKKDIDVSGKGANSKEAEDIKSGGAKSYTLKIEYDTSIQSMREIDVSIEKLSYYFASTYKSYPSVYGTERKGKSLYAYFPFTSQYEAKKAHTDISKILKDME